MAPGTFALGHFQPTAGGSAGVEPGSQKKKLRNFPGTKVFHMATRFQSWNPLKSARDTTLHQNDVQRATQNSETNHLRFLDLFLGKGYSVMQTVGTPKKLVTFFPDQNGLAKPAVGPEQSGDTFASRFSTE